MNPSGTKILSTLLFLVFAFSTANAQVNVTDDITANTTWTADNEYTLDGLIFVDAGATLTIEPGTVIKGLLNTSITTGDGASALVVRRGGEIMAVGTAEEPIIFTSDLDDVSVSDDLTQRDRGLWGGVIILGAATTNQPTVDNQIEGIPETENALYGGTDDDDNSGTLKYVSIRHGGFSISGVEGDEINGLTLGAVGRGTTIENVEVYANFDDCFEWFGGTVNTKWLVGAFCGDDSFDYDQGFRGRGQFWFSIHDDDSAGRGGEHDGGDVGGDDATPFSTPIISNVTYIGSGATASVAGGDNNDRTFAIRDNAGGQYWYSVFTDYPGVAINIEDLADDAAEDSRKRLEAGDLAFADNAWWNYGAGSTLDDIVDGDFAETILADAGNVMVDPMLAGISRTNNGGLDPRPNDGSPVIVPGTEFQVVDPDGHFVFEATDYWGAFRNKENWLEDWTALSSNGFLGDLVVATSTEDESSVPSRFALSQNYPNPFNPVTTIEFAIDTNQEIRLSVIDVLGREVKVLEQGLRTAGSYSVQFDALDLASGMYFYQLKGESTTVVKTMLLMK